MKNFLFNSYTNLIRLILLALVIYALTISNLKASIIGTIYIILTFAPHILKNKTKMEISKICYVLFVTYILCLFFGNGFELHDKTFWWDIFTHLLLGLNIFQIGLIIFKDINKYKLFIILAFTVFVATTWELLEFSLDSLFNMNMQEYIIKNGINNIPTVDVRGHAIIDTMCDLFCAYLSAFVSIIIFKIHHKKRTL